MLSLYVLPSTNRLLSLRVPRAARKREARKVRNLTFSDADPNDHPSVQLAFRLPLIFTELTTWFCNRSSVLILAVHPSMILRSIALRGLPRLGSSNDNEIVCTVIPDRQFSFFAGESNSFNIWSRASSIWRRRRTQPNRRGMR